MIDFVFFGVAGICFVLAAYKARGLRQDRYQPGLGALCLLLITLGFALVFLSDAAQEIENRLYPNLGRLLSNLCTMAAGLEITAQLISVSHPPGQVRPIVRRRVVLFLSSATTMAVLFLSSPLPTRVGDFGSLYGDRPGLVVYTLIYVVSLGTAMIDLLAIAVRYAHHAAPALRVGLGVVGAGSVVALAYLAEKTIFVLSQVWGLPSPLAGHDRPCTSALTPAGCLFAVGFPAMAILLIVIGITLPAWGPRAAVPVSWIRYWWLQRRLRPLWEALHETYPDIGLPPSARSGPRWRLHRRVIEIRDGLLALQPYQDPRIRTAAESAALQAEMQGSKLQAVIEATVIAAALAAVERSTQVEGSVVSPTPGQMSSADDLIGEAEWLAKVATALTSPLVRRQVSLLEQEELA